MQRRECLPAESVAQIAPSVNAAYDKMGLTSVVCAYQVQQYAATPQGLGFTATPRHATTSPCGRTDGLRDGPTD